MGLSLIGLILWGRSIHWDLKRIMPVVLIYGVLEIGWDVSAFMAAFYLSGLSSVIEFLRRREFNLKAALAQAAPERPVAWRWFLVNRTVALVQPLLGGIVAVFISHVPLLEGLGLYTYIVVDLLHTIATLWVVRRRLFPCPLVRRAVETDWQRLVQIDQAAFPDQDQQADPEELLRRVQTSPGTCFVVEDGMGNVAGVLYGRPINLVELLTREELVWRECAGDGDFAAPPKADGVFVVGVAADPRADVKVSDLLEAALARRVTELKYRGVLAGVQLAGYAEAYRLTGIDLDEYVLGEEAGGPRDPLLRTFVKASSMPLLGPLLRPVRGIRDYFPDPRSLDCAALVLGEEPLRRTRFGAGLLDRSRVARLLWGRVLEWALLH